MGCEDACSLLFWYGATSSSTPEVEGLKYLFLKYNYVLQG